MERKLDLPENVYDALVRAAAENGQTPEEWIAARVPPEPDNGASGDNEGPSLLERMDGYIGVIDSREEPYPHRPPTAFGEGVAAKLTKQGINRPWQP
jgi:hypothetical protein